MPCRLIFAAELEAGTVFPDNRIVPFQIPSVVKSQALIQLNRTDRTDSLLCIQIKSVVTVTVSRASPQHISRAGPELDTEPVRVGMENVTVVMAVAVDDFIIGGPVSRICLRGGLYQDSCIPAAGSLTVFNAAACAGNQQSERRTVPEYKPMKLPVISGQQYNRNRDCFFRKSAAVQHRLSRFPRKHTDRLLRCTGLCGTGNQRRVQIIGSALQPDSGSRACTGDRRFQGERILFCSVRSLPALRSREDEADPQTVLPLTAPMAWRFSPGKR